MTIYDYADTPHPATVQQAGYRYGCHSERTGDSRPRGGRSAYIAHPWAKTGTRVVMVTHFLPIPCGHTTRATDPACAGCANRIQEQSNGTP